MSVAGSMLFAAFGLRLALGMAASLFAAAQLTKSLRASFARTS